MPRATRKSSSTSAAAAPKLAHEHIRTLVWAFADMVRDKGNGTTEDYAKVVIPVTAFKRVLDVNGEWLDSKADKYFDQLGLSEPHEIIADINRDSFNFYDPVVVADADRAAVALLRWQHLMAYEDNPNGEVRQIQVGWGQTYRTQAANFLELLVEVAGCFNRYLVHVFDTFEFKALLVEKKIVPYADFYATCHETLSALPFTLKNVSFDIFSSLYMDLLQRFSNDSGKRGGEFFTPTALSKAAWQFLDVKAYAQQLVSGARTSLTMADPTAGSNTFLVYGHDIIRAACDELAPGKVTADAFRFYGQELKSFQYCMGLVNMVFHNTIEQYNLGIDSFAAQNANVITQYFTGIGSQRGKVDIVVANPPYGTKDYGHEYATQTQNTDRRWADGVPLKSEGEFAFMATIVDLLAAQGKAVVVMPLGTLFRGTGAKFRQAYIERDIVEGIVMLPANMFLTTQIPVALWILNKNKAEVDRDKVFMVNASSDFVKVGKFNEWQPQKSIEAYLGRQEHADYSGYVDSQTLAKSEFNLSVQRYFAAAANATEIDICELEATIRRLTAETEAARRGIGALLMGLTAQGAAGGQA